MISASLSPKKPKARRGVALLATLVALTVISLLMVAITWQIVANRRMLERRQHQAQASWLARAGVEAAAARLLANPADYKGETLELIPQSKVQIKVQLEKNSPNTFTITSEARYPADIPNGVARLVTQRFRRVLDEKTIRLEVVPIEEPQR
jgi:type II secretory pathway pseudopilin PulG